jgi:uncharacterized membrane protein
LNPFDLRSALLARHAQHVVLIHFPIALFLAGVTFDLVAHWRRNGMLSLVASYNLFAAAISTIPAVLTGILAWQWKLEAQPLKGILLLHLIFGSLSSLLIWFVWWIRSGDQNSNSWRTSQLPLELGAALVVVFTAHLGGFLSGVNTPF